MAVVLYVPPKILANPTVIQKYARARGEDDDENE
jgi:hypothetical protein